MIDITLFFLTYVKCLKSVEPKNMLEIGSMIFETFEMKNNFKKVSTSSASNCNIHEFLWPSSFLQLDSFIASFLFDML